MPEPRATYRVQLNREFDLRDAKALVPFLSELGISHLYVSPITRSVPGSAHGYDVVDPGAVDNELGGMAALLELAETLRSANMGLLLDVVPNHTAAHPANERWWSLLKEGRESPAASFFDVEWDAPGAGGRVMLPVLDAPAEIGIADGTLHVDRQAPEPVLRYGALKFPLAPDTDSADVGEVLAAQHYLLMEWRSGERVVNYRRFFDVSSLPAVRVEDPSVFDAEHALADELIHAGIADGLRIDHIDGLRDPRTYLERCRARGVAWLVVEKILAAGEMLPESWPVDGTTGYEFAERVGLVLHDGDGVQDLDRLWTELSGDSRTFDEIMSECRVQVLERLLAADVDRITRNLNAALGDPPDLHAAVIATMAALDVYRTYCEPGAPASPTDRRRIDAAVKRAAGAAPTETLRALGDALVNAPETARQDEGRLRFQQLSGAVAAKGVEDTASYRYLRLVSRNEVGSDPGRLAPEPAEFHAANADAARRRPRGLLALTTHDTKRSADVRARLAVLTEVPTEWRAFVARRRAGLASAWQGMRADPSTEYLLLQSAVGAWPIDAERLGTYLRKAAREAKLRTSWRDPEPAFEEALDRLVAALLGEPDARADVESFVAIVLVPGRVNSLSQVLVQCTAPGVPDVYRGDALWNLTLVDPDNRRRFEPSTRADLLAELADATGPPTEALRDKLDPGRPKLWTLSRALDLRRRHPECFGAGANYEPVEATGELARHVLAYRRGDAAMIVAPLTTRRRDGRWGDTRVPVPPGSWHDVLNDRERHGGVVPASTLLDAFPIALLERKE